MLQTRIRHNRHLCAMDVRSSDTGSDRADSTHISIADKYHMRVRTSVPHFTVIWPNQLLSEGHLTDEQTDYVAHMLHCYTISVADIGSYPEPPPTPSLLSDLHGAPAMVPALLTRAPGLVEPLRDVADGVSAPTVHHER